MIRFGTSGWRALMGDEFTFHNVRVVVQAICNYLRSEGMGLRGVLVGYDTRFLSDRFAREAAKVFSHNRIPCFLCNRDAPTPAMSYEIIRRNLDGALNFTASHNPPEYNGLKFSTDDGAPALPEVTQRIEAHIRRLEGEKRQPAYYADESYIHEVDVAEPYLKLVASKVDFAKIARSGISITIDPLYGTARDYLDRLLIESGCSCEVIHNFKDPYFGGYSPECSEQNLANLRVAMMEKGSHVGIATDGDADRFGILDSDGTFIHPNYILALLLRYLLRSRPQLTGGVARSVATTHLLDRIAARSAVPLYETPVGFKYIGELLLEGKLIMGGEESAGFTMSRHLPEKDGILACLLVAEMMADAGPGRKLSDLLDELFTEVGPLYNMRLSLKLPPESAERIGTQLQNPPDSLNSRRVITVNRLDGVKLLLEDGSWLLLRPSGTEPLVRLYAESPTREGLASLIEASKDYVQRIQ